MKRNRLILFWWSIAPCLFCTACAKPLLLSVSASTASGTVATRPSQPDCEVASLIAAIDCDPDYTHMGHSDATGRLREIGWPAFLPLLDAYERGSRQHRIYVRTVLEEIVAKDFGIWGPDWFDAGKDRNAMLERYRAFMGTMPAFDVKAVDEQRSITAQVWREWFHSRPNVEKGM